MARASRRRAGRCFPTSPRPSASRTRAATSCWTRGTASSSPAPIRTPSAPTARTSSSIPSRSIPRPPSPGSRERALPGGAAGRVGPGRPRDRGARRRAVPLRRRRDSEDRPRDCRGHALSGPAPCTRAPDLHRRSSDRARGRRLPARRGRASVAHARAASRALRRGDRDGVEPARLATSQKTFAPYWKRLPRRAGRHAGSLADGLFLELAVPAGRHRVEGRFRCRARRSRSSASGCSRSPPL